MYRTESLVQYFPQLAFLNFIFNSILSRFFLYLKVYANEQNVNNDITKDSLITLAATSTRITHALEWGRGKEL